jgi:hypothetical protein
VILVIVVVLVVAVVIVGPALRAPDRPQYATPPPEDDA